MVGFLETGAYSFPDLLFALKIWQTMGFDVIDLSSSGRRGML